MSIIRELNKDEIIRARIIGERAKLTYCDDIFLKYVPKKYLIKEYELKLPLECNLNKAINLLKNNKDGKVFFKHSGLIFIKDKLNSKDFNIVILNFTKE